ncbi:hypothetical protein [Criblamydia sequanensis]|uniref:Uncharacterized protein n=1 Tax=Candidatus Criblamydia sequanensis CRIB-18 TaxID=1437425 RepID=A0A090CZ21_9BACT|nr:hypothetical protein [Criblamydia sequanensis]CDR34102.1 hypothetical protein CSEC_1282 [Criblamydia sequanensis CRIB-18]
MQAAYERQMAARNKAYNQSIAPMNKIAQQQINFTNQRYYRAHPEQRPKPKPVPSPADQPVTQKQLEAKVNPLQVTTASLKKQTGEQKVIGEVQAERIETQEKVIEKQAKEIEELRRKALLQKQTAERQEESLRLAERNTAQSIGLQADLLRRLAIEEQKNRESAEALALLREQMSLLDESQAQTSHAIRGLEHATTTTTCTLSRVQGEQEHLSYEVEETIRGQGFLKESVATISIKQKELEMAVEQQKAATVSQQAGAPKLHKPRGFMSN